MIYVTNNPDRLLAYPDYHSGVWRSPQIIYGKKEEGLTWEYSDRIWEWDYDKAKAASEQAITEGLRDRTARYMEKFLRFFYDKPDLELVCVLGGCNLASGFPYYVYGFKGQNNA